MSWNNWLAFTLRLAVLGSAAILILASWLGLILLALAAPWLFFWFPLLGVVAIFGTPVSRRLDKWKK